MGRKKKNEDISNKAVVFMLVAFILISVVSLGLYMKVLQEAELGFVVHQSSDVEGIASIKIISPMDLLPSFDNTEGIASIKIIEKPSKWGV